jgi:chaperonin GroES
MALEQMVEEGVTFRPLYGRILVKLSAAPDRSRGGVLLAPGSRLDESGTRDAKVLAVASSRPLQTGDRPSHGISVGDRVVIGQFSGVTLPWLGKEYLCVEADQVYGVLEYQEEAEPEEVF